MTVRADTDQVARAWLRTVNGIPTNGVAAQLPSDNSSWAASGFMTAYAVGGSRDRYVPIKNPVVRCTAWAVTLDSDGQVTSKAPWGKASQLCEAVDAACRSESFVKTVLNLPGDYPNAKVLEAYLLTEPQKVFGDESAYYAQMYFDLALHWIEVSS